MKKIDFKTGSLWGVLIILVITLVSTMVLGIQRDKLYKALENTQTELTIASNELSTTKSTLKETEDKLISTEVELQTEIEKSKGLSTSLGNMSKELETANATIADLKSDEYELVYMGDFTITHYCTEKRKHICGTGTGLTATGTVVTAGRTVAVDPSVIPYGTQMYIEGYGFRTAEDCGGAVDGKHIDALSMGTGYSGVWLLVKKS